MNTDRFKFRIWDEASGVYCNANSFAIADCGVFLRIGNHGTALSLQNPQGLVFEQCTGLKDADGNLIYEGDILQTPSNTYFVRHDEKTCGFVCEYRLGYRMGLLLHSDLTFKKYRVIGNIHENPELLEAHK